MQLCEICNKPVRQSEGIYVCERGHVVGNAVETVDYGARIIPRNMSSIKDKLNTQTQKSKKTIEFLNKIPIEGFMYLAKKFFNELNAFQIKAKEENEYYFLAFGYFLTTKPDATEREINGMMKCCLFLLMKDLYETGNLKCSTFEFPKKNKRPEIKISDRLYFHDRPMDKIHGTVSNTIKFIEKDESNKWPLFIEDFEEFYSFERFRKHLIEAEKDLNISTGRLHRIDFVFNKLNTFEIKDGIKFFKEQNLKLPKNFSLEFASKSFDRIVSGFEMLKDPCYRLERYYKKTKHFKDYPQQFSSRCSKVDVRSPVFIKAAFIIFYKALLLDESIYIIHDEVVIIFLFCYSSIFRICIDFDKLELPDMEYNAESYSFNKYLKKAILKIQNSKSPVSFGRIIKEYNHMKILFYFKITYFNSKRRVFVDAFSPLINIFSKIFNAKEKQRKEFLKDLIKKKY